MHFDLQSGQVVDGKYEVRHKIGQGGMGAVYLVQHLTLNRAQALKLIQTGESDGGWEVDQDDYINEMLARFTRETQTLARFAHPNIIFCTDAGTLEAEVLMQGAPRLVHMPFLVMEFFEGLEGKKWTVRERPSAQRVLAVARQLASGLACAHKAGVLHRDLKPQNILIGTDDQVKIVDFGLAKPEGAAEVDLTRTKSAVAGTMAYLAPEYAAGSGGRRHHTQVSDLWALGCCLYFFLTHRNVFTMGRDENDWELLARISNGEYPPISDIRQDLSPEFLAVLQDLLQVDPAKRMASATVLLERLERVGRADDPTKPAFVPPKRKEAAPPPPSSGTDLFSAKPVVRVATVTPARTTPTKVGPSRNAALDDLPSSGAGTAAMRPPPKAASAKASVNVDADRDISARDLLAMQSAVEVAADVHTESMSAVDPSAMKSARRKSSAGVPGEETLLRAMEAEVEGGGAARARDVVRASPISPSKPPGRVEPEVEEDEQATPSAASMRMVAPSFQAPAVGSASKEKKAKSALFLPAAAVTVIGVMGAMLLLTTGGDTKKASTGPVVPQTSAEAQREQEKQRTQADTEMRALEQEKRKQSAEDKQRQAMLAAAMANPQQPVQPAPPPDAAPPEPEPSKKGTGGGGGDARRLVVASTTAAPPPAPDSPWARFGSRSTNTGASAGTTVSPASTASSDRRVGVRIPVRVNVELASSPSGPVIATVTQPTNIGDMTIPAGTEIHGQTSGSQGTRLTINFTTAIVNGKNIAISGTALGLDGKAGIVGTRAGADGTDVAAAAAAGAVGALGAGVAAALGEENAGGAAVRGGTGAATQNTQRLNTTQDIVSTKKGARFLVYVTR